MPAHHDHLRPFEAQVNDSGETSEDSFVTMSPADVRPVAMASISKPGRRGRGSLTIEDVAREAGVSAMTVSRVINKEPNVREETRQLVRETIERLNYSPNTAARNLAAGEMMRIGLLYSNPSAAYLSQFLVGALEGARAAGVHLVIEPCISSDEAVQCETARNLAKADQIIGHVSRCPKIIDADVEGIGMALSHRNRDDGRSSILELGQDREGF